MGLRIVQIVENLEIGGLERMALDLAIAQKAAGHQPFIYCVFKRGALAGEADQAGVPVVEFRKKSGFSWTTVRQISRRLRQDGAQIVHTHNSVIHHYGVLAARMAGIRAVVNTRHGLGTLHTSARQELYFKATLPFTSAFVFVCEDGRRFFVGRRGVPASRSQVIFNGIPLDKFLAIPSAVGSQRPRIRFGAVGRMVPAKAHSDLIEAFAILRRRLPEAHLRIAGGGPLMETAQAQASRLGLDSSVSLEGATRDVASFLGQLDVFVLSSITEGLPLVILEAMAAALPVVSTRVGGVPEVAPEGEVAWYGEPAQPATLAEAMYQAATSPDLAARGARARSLAQEHYGLEMMQKQYESLYHRLLSRR